MWNSHHCLWLTADCQVSSWIHYRDSSRLSRIDSYLFLKLSARALISISLLEYISFHQASPSYDAVPGQPAAITHRTTTYRRAGDVYHWHTVRASSVCQCGRERVWHFLISHQVFGAAGLAYKQRWFLCHNWALQIRSISSAAAGPVRLPSHQHLRTRRRPGVTCMADDKGISGTVRWGTTTHSSDNHTSSQSEG